MDGKYDDYGRPEYLAEDQEAGLEEITEDHGTEEIMENQGHGANRVMRLVSYKQTKTKLCNSSE